ncbi:MAG: hypothetical protein GX939_01245 [Clostridiaceae bacterium]|jgi:hypothetical protein|nr:hypothetical protein [Clostridiaceae bacterium]
MKYIVMECYLSYAVVLDEDGRFLKVANRQYEVGQTVTDVIEMRVPKSIPQNKKMKRWLVPVAAVAACLIIALIFVLQLDHRPFASIYMSINPEIRIDVNRHDVVVGLEGVNADGERLIESYNYKKKDVDTVIGDLLDRAIDMGYLLEGGQIAFVFDAESGEWVVSRSDSLEKFLNEHLGKKISVTIVLTDKKTDTNKVIIPVVPGESDHNDSEHGETQPSSAPTVSSETDNGEDDPDDMGNDPDNDDDRDDNDNDDIDDDNDIDDDDDGKDSDDDIGDNDPDDDDNDNGSDPDDDGDDDDIDDPDDIDDDDPDDNDDDSDDDDNDDDSDPDDDDDDDDFDDPDDIDDDD